MKHILNNLTEQEKNDIREQHSGGMKVMTEKFSAVGYTMPAIPLTINCPGTQTVTADGAGNYVLPSFNSLTNAINSNCDAVVSQSPAIGTTVGVGTHLITMTANGSVSCNFNLVVEAALSNEDFNPNSNIVIYPNPTNSILNIKGEFNSLEKIAVYNMLGQVVMENVVSGNENQLNVSSLANGIYQIRFMDSKKTVKFVKE